MQHLIKNSILCALLYFFTSCSNDFLEENITPVYYPMGFSNIYISPDWQSANYEFMLPGIREIDYEIVSKPTWLNLANISGHISDSIAIIECTASKNSDFNTVGLYMDFMTVKADGKNYKVPVSYINEGNPKVQVNNKLIISYNSYEKPALQIYNNGTGILIWNLISMPDWLEIDSAKLEITSLYLSPYSSYNIPLQMIPSNNAWGSLAGTMVLATNDKAYPSVTININADLGTPQLDIYTNLINFSSTESSKSVTIYNNGDGMLIWQFENIPEWLTINPSSGMNKPSNINSNIVFNCDRTKLLPGQNTAIVTLKSNDSSNPSNNITVMAVAPGLSENIRVVDGNIIDAEFNKNTNTLYYVTTAPNKFIAYDVIERKALNEISLSKAPTGFAISEDWTKAAVGHNGNISALSLSSNTVTATYALDYSVNDIAWGDGDLFCYTQVGGSFTKLHWINTADGTLFDESDNQHLDGKSIIKKVPNQPYLIATRNSTSPNGLMAYDVATKELKSYSHMDLGNFWISENGEYIFSRSSDIYRTTSSTGSNDTFDADINVVGKFNTGSETYYGIHFVYQSNGFLWVLQKEYYWSEEVSKLFQIEDNDYTLVKEIFYDQLCQPDMQTTPFTVGANYVFANSEGTELSVLCKGVSNDSWLIQFISLN